jgi:ATP-dependent Clp protease ATP-binding subunit ClpB
MTSNIGSQYIVDLKPGQEKQMRERVLEQLRAQFKPEFLNRVDEVIIFHQLTRDQVKQIIDLQVNSLKRRLSERHIDIELTDAAKELLLDEGYDPAYGARPMKRAIQRLVLDPLAVKVLGGEFKDGDMVVVDAGKVGIAFKLKQRVA